MTTHTTRARPWPAYVPAIVGPDIFCPHCADTGSLGYDPDGERAWCDCPAGRFEARSEDDRLEELWLSLGLVPAVAA